MDERANGYGGFFMNVITTFAYSIIAIFVIGAIIGDLGKEAGGLFSLGREGLSYRSIFQVFICSIVIGSLRTLVLSDLVLKKMLFLWRLILLLLLALVGVSFLSVIFRWFPVEEWEAWIAFMLTFTACFIISSAVMITKTRMDDKKYIKLLSEYKANHKSESGE